MRRFPLIACTTLLPLFVTGVFLFSASGIARADLPPQAQDAFHKGVVAKEKSDYSQAVLDFQDSIREAQANGLFPTPEIYQKLGETESKMPGRELRAICWFGAYLSAIPQATDAAEVKSEIVSLDRTSRGEVKKLIQLTEDTGRQVAAHERARHNVEGSLDDVVVLWDQFGDFDKAEEIADTIEYGPKRCEAYNRVSWARVDAGEFVGVWETIAKQEKTAGPVNDDPYVGYQPHLDLVLLETHMAQEQIKTGDGVGAQKTISAAKILADQFTHSYSISQAYRSIAEAQAAAGDIEGAKKSVELIKGEDARADHKFDALLAISEAQVKAGDLKGAQETFATAGKTSDLIPQPDTKLDKRLALAKAQVEAGDVTGARRTLAAAVSELRREGSKEPNAYFSLGLAQASMGDIEAATATADYLQDASAKSTMLERITEIKKTSTVPLDRTPPNPVYPWLWKLEGMGMETERVPRLNDPLFSDHANYMSALLKRDITPEQTFSDLQRVAREMIDLQREIDGMLKKQFKL